MKTQTKTTIALFLAGFFAKDIIDSIGFLLTDNYPLEVFGLTITAMHHKIMLAVSASLTALLLYYGLRKRERIA
jgi:hypothetical protein